MISQPNINQNISNYRMNSFRSQPYVLNRGSYLLNQNRSRSPSPVNISNSPTNLTNQNLNTQSFKKIMQDVYMYPAGFAQLLRHQDRNLKSFKIKISKQKQKVDVDMQQFKTQLNHTLQDLRLSLHAHLDRLYQSYLQKAAKFRGQAFQINRLKQQLQIELGSTTVAELQAKIKNDTQNINYKSRSSNIPQRDNDKNLSKINQLLQKDPNNPLYISPKLNPIATLQAQTNQTINNMQVGNKQLKKYYILNYITEMQKQRMTPLTDLQRQLTILNGYNNGFYQSIQFHKILTNLRQIMSNQVKKVYNNNYLYIRDIDTILMKQRQINQKNNRVLDGLDLQVINTNMNNNNGDIVTYGNNNNNNNNNISNRSYGTFIPINNSSLNQNIINNPNLNNPNLKLNSSLNQNIQNTSLNKLSKMYGTNLHGTISPSQQSLRINSIQNINLVQQPINIQLPNTINSQTSLCSIYINNQIVLGLKDGIIQIFSCDGHNICTLKEHNTNICTLNVIRIKNYNYLVSGSDIGECKIIIWDPVTWQPKYIFNGHQAAITGIIDLQDDNYILSAGYDKKMNVYSLQQNKLVYSVPQSQTPITSLVINKNGNKLITACLDKSLYVWNILRDNRMKTQNLILQRKIQNNSTICSMVVSQILPQLVIIATKDNKIKLVNIEKGQSYKTININNDSDINNNIGYNINGYPLQITIIQRDNKPYYPIVLVWPYKQQKLYQVNTETTLVSVKNLSNNGGALQYGYGVSPKCFYVSDSNKGALVYSVNQKNYQNSNGNCMTVHKIQELR